jgi:hypothetical protein
MSRDELSDGYVRLMADLYEPAAYFDRFDDLYLKARMTIDRAWRAHARAHPWLRTRRNAVLWFQSPALFARSELQVLRIYALKCAIHWPIHVFVRTLRDRAGPLVNSY